MFEFDKKWQRSSENEVAEKNITLAQDSKETEILAKTLGKVENEQILSVRKSVYKKLVDWLINEKSKKYTGVD